MRPGMFRSTEVVSLGAGRPGIDGRETLEAVTEQLEPMPADWQRALAITGSHEERPPWGGWNSADHRAVGLAVLDAVHDAGNRWIFPELVEDGLQPWRGVRWVAVAGSSRPTHAVDVSAVLDVAVASLAAHQVYLQGLGADHGMPDPKAFVELVTGAGAPQFGGVLALTFELIPFA